MASAPGGGGWDVWSIPNTSSRGGWQRTRRVFVMLNVRQMIFGLAIGMAMLTGGPTQAKAKSAPAPVEQQAMLDGYRLGSGDKVRLITFGETALTGEFEVSGAGVVALPLIGEIPAAGLTTSELQERITAALREGYLNDPRVSVEVMNYRPFYVLGEVNKPGEYPFSSGLTVFNAVATANGFTYRADRKKAYIRRAGQTAEDPVALTPGTPVMPGDTIRIGERYF